MRDLNYSAFYRHDHTIILLVSLATKSMRTDTMDVWRYNGRMEYSVVTAFYNRCEHNHALDIELSLFLPL